MPYYSDLGNLPQGVKDNLPLHARVIYLNAFNNVWEEYKYAGTRSSDDSREAVASKVAWPAVMKAYEKDELTGLWKRKKSRVPA